MGFNSGIEWKKFNEKWKHLRVEYAACGMDEAAIDAMYEYDLSVLNSDRRYAEHTQSMDFLHDEEVPELGSRIFDAVTIPANEVDPDRENSWIDEIENERLVEAIRTLSESDMELLTLFAFQGYTMTEIAQIKSVSIMNISKKVTRIKKYLKNFI